MTAKFAPLTIIKTGVARKTCGSGETSTHDVDNRPVCRRGFHRTPTWERREFVLKVRQWKNVLAHLRPQITHAMKKA